MVCVFTEWVSSVSTLGGFARKVDQACAQKQHSGSHSLRAACVGRFDNFGRFSQCVFVRLGGCLFVWRTNDAGSRCPDLLLYHSTVLCDLSFQTSRTRSFGRSCCCSLQLNGKELLSEKRTQFHSTACDFKWHAISPPYSGFARKVVSDQVRAQNGISSSHF